MVFYTDSTSFSRQTTKTNNLSILINKIYVLGDCGREKDERKGMCLSYQVLVNGQRTSFLEFLAPDTVERLEG